MRYYQDEQRFGQHPSNAHHNILDPEIRPHRRFLDSRKVASSNFASGTKFSILSIPFYTQRRSAGRDLQKHWGQGLAYDAGRETCREK